MLILIRVSNQIFTVVTPNKISCLWLELICPWVRNFISISRNNRFLNDFIYSFFSFSALLLETCLTSLSCWCLWDSSWSTQCLQDATIIIPPPPCSQLLDKLLHFGPKCLLILCHLKNTEFSGLRWSLPNEVQWLRVFLLVRPVESDRGLWVWTSALRSTWLRLSASVPVRAQRWTTPLQIAC